MLDLREVWTLLGSGRWLTSDPGAAQPMLTAVSTDTRHLPAGALFVALRGERHDGHDHIAQAVAAGAAALLVERWTPACQVPAFCVRDTRQALAELAAGWRRRFALPVIAVTGSNGKTTVKEMIAAILAAWVGEADRLATQGNLNNEIGVSLTVFRLRDTHRAAVFELGMNHPGEIAGLAGMVQPQVALVNNAQREHQEFLGSVEATARENGAVIAALPADGVAVYPGDDAAHRPIWAALAGSRRSLSFGLDAGCAVHAPADARPEAFDLHLPGQTVSVRLAIAGQHNVRNALAAAACCHAVGVPAVTIATGLAAFRPVAGRLRHLQAASGAALIDDSYNANPDSVRAAIDVLAARTAPRVLVLGDMGEVGAEGPRFHAEVGAYARDRGIERLLGFGAASAGTVAAYGTGAEHYETIESLCARARECAVPGATVLVKGSRSMRMERVVQALATADEAAQIGGHA